MACEIVLKTKKKPEPRESYLWQYKTRTRDNVRQRNLSVDERLSEIAESYMDTIYEDNTKSTTKVFCGHCGSVMHGEKLGHGVWQHACPECGTSGPRADSPSEAASLAQKLFPD